MLTRGAATVVDDDVAVASRRALWTFTARKHGEYSILFQPALYQWEKWCGGCGGRQIFNVWRPVSRQASSKRIRSRGEGMDTLHALVSVCLKSQLRCQFSYPVSNFVWFSTSFPFSPPFFRGFVPCLWTPCSFCGGVGRLFFCRTPHQHLRNSPLHLIYTALGSHVVATATQ